jgi:hypothetical protein
MVRRACHPSKGASINWEIMLQPGPGMKCGLLSKIIDAERDYKMTQVVQHLPSKLYNLTLTQEPPKMERKRIWVCRFHFIPFCFLQDQSTYMLIPNSKCLPGKIG